MCLDLFSSKQNNMSDCSQSNTKHIYSKTCLKRTLEIDKTKVLMTNGSLKPHSHCAGVATVHPDAGQPVYRDAPGHMS